MSPKITLAHVAAALGLGLVSLCTVRAPAQSMDQPANTESWIESDRHLFELPPARGQDTANTALLPASEPHQHIVSEISVGALAHDLPILGPQREHGVDVNAELLFVSPISEQAVSGLPPVAQWLLRPRPQAGVTGNLSGYTSQAYLGLVWTAVPARDLLRDGDRLLVDLGFGGAVNNDPTLPSITDRARLGSNLLFHPNLQLGYGVDARSSVGLYYEHSSNAHLARVNEGLNNIGLRFSRQL